MNRVELDILRLLAEMPFPDRLEVVAVSGWSRGAVYQAVESLERAGLAVSLSHSTQIIFPTRRYCLTSSGLYQLAQQDGVSVDDLLRTLPVSEQWRRLLLERLDALASIYRLASAVSGVAHPIGIRWYRAMPIDAAIQLPDGRVIYVVRQGPTTDRTAFSKRLWRLRRIQQPSAVLLLAPDEVRLRHSGSRLAGLPFPAFLALESEAVSAGTRAPIWRTPSWSAPLSLRTALDLMGNDGSFPVEKPTLRASLPGDIEIDCERDWMLPVLLRPVEKRALDLLYDWPWLNPAHLAALLGVKRSRLSEVVTGLVGLGLVSDVSVMGNRRLTLSDRGLGVLTRRDRASVGAVRKRWSSAPMDSDAPVEWRSVCGRRSRQLLRNLEHTESVHWFLAVLARQAGSHSTEIVQLDPPRQASRYFSHDYRLRSVQPDAFGVISRGGATWPFFLEWERRAVRPITMAARLAPYLRYYSTYRPTDDHGSLPSILVVFENDLARTHFLRLAREEMARTGVNVPLLVSCRSLLEREGPLGQAWSTPVDPQPGYAFQRQRDLRYASEGALVGEWVASPIPLV